MYVCELTISNVSIYLISRLSSVRVDWRKRHKITTDATIRNIIVINHLCDLTNDSRGNAVVLFLRLELVAIVLRF